MVAVALASPLLRVVGAPVFVLDIACESSRGKTKALQVAAVKARLEEMGGEARGSTPEEMKVMVSHEIEKWQQVVADAKIPKQ